MGGRKKSEGVIVVNKKGWRERQRVRASEGCGRGDSGRCSKMLGDVA